MSANGHVQIGDFSDREIMLMILDLGGDVSVSDLAARVYGWGPMDVEDKAKVAHGHRCVTSRLVWMRRYGLTESWVEVEAPKKRSWKVSGEGKLMLQASIGRSVSETISAGPDSHGLTIAHLCGEKLVTAGSVTGQAMRRELLYQIKRRKRVKG